MSTYAVHVRTFDLVPRDNVVWVDAPDELAAFLGARKYEASASHPALTQVLEATYMGENTPPNLIDVVVDVNGEEVEIEVL